MTPIRSDGSADAVAAAVQQIWSEYAASLEAGDVSRWIALWTADGIQMPPGQPPIVGREQIRVSMAGLLEANELDFSITNHEVTSAGGWAYARGVYQATFTPRQGGDAVSVDGKYLSILARHADGSWRIHRDCFNSNVAG